MHSPTNFNALHLAVKLRHIAMELRRAHALDLATERFARRLEAHADAMLDPERTPDYRPFSGCEAPSRR